MRTVLIVTGDPVELVTRSETVAGWSGLRLTGFCWVEAAADVPLIRADMETEPEAPAGGPAGTARISRAERDAQDGRAEPPARLPSRLGHLSSSTRR